MNHAILVHKKGSFISLIYELWKLHRYHKSRDENNVYSVQIGRDL